MNVIGTADFATGKTFEMVQVSTKRKNVVVYDVDREGRRAILCRASTPAAGWRAIRYAAKIGQHSECSPGVEYASRDEA